MSGISNTPCIHCGAAISPGVTVCAHCGQAQLPEESPDTWIGRTVDGKYEIEEVLGVGGMGMVFAARRVLVGDRVALKVLFPRFLESPLQRRLFRDEAIAAARLSHDNVVSVFDADVSADGAAYIAMELLDGRNFKALLRERAPIAADEAVSIAIQVCAGLDAAHRARIIHRDLKPDNIFLESRPDGGYRVKLVDFGIAAMLDADRSDEKRQRLGTLRYMAPEQCKGGPVDPRADLYALGVVLYEALTRRRATGKTVSAVMSQVPDPPNMHLPPEQQLPPPLEALLLRMLAKRADERPPSAAAAGEAFAAIDAVMRGSAPPTILQPLLDPTPGPTPIAPVVRPQPTADDGGPSLLVFIGLAVAVGAIGGLIWALV